MDNTGRGGESSAEAMTHQHAIDSMASERYLLGEMGGRERDLFEEHYFDCTECAEDLRAAERMRAGVGAAASRAGAPVRAADPELRPRVTAFPSGSRQRPEPGARTLEPRVQSPEPSGQSPAPGRPQPPFWSRETLLTAIPWAAAASLAVFFGYQSLVVIPGLREEIARPQALAPALLRGAARTAPNREPLARVPEDGGHVTLAVELVPERETLELQYELLGREGNELLSGRAPVPRQGAPLMLLLPAHLFEVPARYTVVVRDADDPQKVFGEYPFVTSR